MRGTEPINFGPEQLHLFSYMEKLKAHRLQETHGYNNIRALKEVKFDCGILVPRGFLDFRRAQKMRETNLNEYELLGLEPLATVGRDRQGLHLRRDREEI